MGYAIAVIITGLIFGFVTKYMNENKGYEGGFWWGFFLGIIGIIVIACKPQNTTAPSDYSTTNYSSTQNNQNISQPIEKNETVPNVDNGLEDKDLLSKLEQLHAQGVLDDDEFKLKSRELRLDDDTRKRIQALNELVDKGVLSPEELAQKKEALIIQAEEREKTASVLNNLKEIYEQGLIGKEEYLSKWKSIAGDVQDAVSALSQNLSEIDKLKRASDVIQYIKSDPILDDAFGMDIVLQYLEKVQITERPYGSDHRGIMNFINNYIKSNGKTYTFSKNSPPTQCPNCGQTIYGVEPFQCTRCGATLICKD